MECHDHNNCWKKDAVFDIYSIRSKTQPHKKDQVGNFGCSRRLLLSVLCVEQI